MRFTTAWAKLSSQNLSLKTALVCLSLSLFGVCLLLIKLALKEPLLIERQCYSRATALASVKHTEDEIKVFVEQALLTRFNSRENPNPAFLSQEEFQNRLIEQRELQTRKMNQSLLINEIEIENETVSVEADRVISVSGVKSALSFPLLLTIAKQTRSVANPYGLVVLNVKSRKKKGENNE